MDYSSVAALLLILNSLTATSRCFAVAQVSVRDIMLPSSANMNTDERALLAFKSAVTSDPSGFLTNWSATTSICRWTGVSCGTKHNRVTALNVSGSDLGGTIPPHLGNLTFLRSLDISSNRFQGTMPSRLSYLRRLKELNAAFNSFTGGIPPFLGALSQLQHIHLSNNNFSGGIPSNFNASKLQTIDMGFNFLEGNLPHSILNIPSLVQIDLSYNRLSGTLPNDICSNTRELRTISLSANQFSGEIPRNIEKCRELENLLLGGNHFNGSIPSEIGSLSRLKDLALWSNNFTGGIPDEIGNLSSLEHLRFGGMNLTGKIPSSIFNISSLKLMSLQNNSFSGSIPTLNYLSELQNVYLFNNYLTGRLPSDICSNLPNIRMLLLWGNQLSGQIPAGIGKCRFLEDLELSANSFSDNIPSEIGNLSMLRVLFLGQNGFKGGIPVEIGNLLRLEALNMGSASLTGGIPKQIGNLTSLKRLALSYNYLSGNNSLHGSIPHSIFNISTLTQLDLPYNQFSGGLPPAAGISLSNLQTLSLQNNKVTGPIPSSITNSSKLWQLNLIDNSFSGSIPDFSNLKLLKILYIRGNNLTGEESRTQELRFLISLTKCRYLEVIDVSQNPLKGTIPKAIGNFSDTEATILSSIRHRNLVRIISCCSNTEFKALILEYMPNGSLEKWLYSDDYYLDLGQRLKVAIDVASALEYLHHGHTFPVVHCDIKPSNVLLDEGMTARIGDFGISKLFDEGETMIRTKTLATVGYASPEYGTEGKVSTSGDVYSFGIVLLEMFTNKKPTDDMFNGEMSLKEWVSAALQENAIVGVVDRSLLSREDQHFIAKEQCVSSIFDLAMNCLAISPEERINMVEVVATLHKIKAWVLSKTIRR